MRGRDCCLRSKTLISRARRWYTEVEREEREYEGDAVNCYAHISFVGRTYTIACHKMVQTGTSISASYMRSQQLVSCSHRSDSDGAAGDVGSRSSGSVGVCISAQLRLKQRKPLSLFLMLPFKSYSNAGLSKTQP